MFNVCVMCDWYDWAGGPGVTAAVVSVAQCMGQCRFARRAQTGELGKSGKAGTPTYGGKGQGDWAAEKLVGRAQSAAPQSGPRCVTCIMFPTRRLCS
jgi:hypothetical protein